LHKNFQKVLDFLLAGFLIYSESPSRESGLFSSTDKKDATAHLASRSGSILFIKGTCCDEY
ncbi:hypothetical protein DXA34_10105, partial [[Clostridium] symbiosum]|uniref:hypothetical protein n=1 Tax=Clostridium symbiosum TaxID=1512 RepID=UPI000FF5557B